MVPSGYPAKPDIASISQAGEAICASVCNEWWMNFSSWAWQKVADEKWWPHCFAQDPSTCPCPRLPLCEIHQVCTALWQFRPQRKNLSSQTTGAAYLFVSNCVNFPQRDFLPCCRLSLIDDARNWWVKPSTIFIAACCGGYCPLNQWSLFGESHEKFKAWVQEGHCFIWKTSMLHFLWTDSIL